MSEEQIKSLKRRRAHIKGQLTRFSNYLNSDGCNVDEVIIRLERIHETLREFENTQFDINQFEQSDDFSELEQFENSFYLITTRAQTLIASKKSVARNVTDDNNYCATRNDSVSYHDDVPKYHDLVKLPQISLPTYFGNYEEFQSFKDQFESLIGKRGDLDGIQKFCYLKSCLKGDALEFISALETSAKNYAKAWELLNQRFDNKRLVVARHLKSIFDCDKIERESSSKLRTLCDTTSKHMRALESLGLPVEQWDVPFVFYLSQKLDLNSLRDWEGQCDKNTLPTLQTFLEFLQTRALVLEALESEKNAKVTYNQFPSRHRVSHATYVHTETPNNTVQCSCPFCDLPHKAFNCRKFLASSIEERKGLVLKAKICSNCLNQDIDHTSEQCPRGHCRKCSAKHNTLLHEDILVRKSLYAVSDGKDNAEASNLRVTNHSTKSGEPAYTVLLSTAVVNVVDAHGRLVKCRVLLDSGSQVNLITERMSQYLGLKCNKTTSTISGISGLQTKGNKSLICAIVSRDGRYSTSLDCLVVSKITLDLPTSDIDTSSWNMPPHVELADPSFFKASQIDILVGAGEFFSIIGNNQLSLGPGLPSLRSSTFGWVVSGKVTSTTTQTSYHSGVIVTCHLNLERQMRQFWELEEVDAHHRMNPDDRGCELTFKQTTRRDECGRFEVNLPTNSHYPKLGETKDIALRRFLNLERKLDKMPELKARYIAFMNEYKQLGHMELNLQSDEAIRSCYLPHHAVLKEASSTTKLRVVFDASCKSTSGYSLNDVLMVGPVIQQDLMSIVMRFRKHQFVMTADVKKMYRQVNVTPEQRNLQRIFWRENTNDKLQVFNLKTLTYGTAPASYLATRCLQELSLEYQHAQPLGAAAIACDFYVDDLLTGSDSLDEAKLMQRQIIQILQTGKFELHKWCANRAELLDSIPESEREAKYELTAEKQVAIKTLGIWWNPTGDVFKYTISTSSETKITKRLVLSEISSIFDPLGLLGPVNFQAKLFMQRLWKLNIEWDTQLDAKNSQDWISFREQLNLLSQIDVPRCVIVTGANILELHGFCDASESGYGASVYLKSQGSDESPKVYLICSKSRVAPLKTLTIPRLELCGALLLSRLIAKCVKALALKSFTCHLWCDSTVALAWISQPSTNWKTFVSHRVSEIHDLTKDCTWHHVPSIDNPSDLLSRGMSPSEISESHLWWNGPYWLHSSSDLWPSQTSLPKNVPETRQNIVLVTSALASIINFERFSSLDKLVNTFSYVLRFVDRVLRKPFCHGSVSAKERDRSLHLIIRLIQSETFQIELFKLSRQQKIPTSSKLSSLNPFLCKDGLIRVGGRLAHADLSFDAKHQIILPSNHKFTYLLVDSMHKRHFHAGPQLLIASIRQRFWPLRIKAIARQVFRQCVTCFRSNPKTASQIMGDLPSQRVQISRPFTNAGVDFCGPFAIKSSKLRNAKTTKGYLAVFICLATRAVHIEVVGDLATASFINCLKRFYARRGKSVNMYSDNGTNLVGAARELNRSIITALKDDSLTQYISKEAITWNFIPPRAPHFGGLWESAIKSLKYHLKRTVGDASLTFEEMATFCAMIEACLNSRPLIPLSNDPLDLNALTPGHFLIGDALTALVEQDLTDYQGGLLNRWRRLQQMYQHFWKRWSQEYLSSLQSRAKWKGQAPNLQLNRLVLVKEENLPPAKWCLGRIVQTYPGADGLIRVADVKTSRGLLKRPIVKLCPLPEQEDQDNTSENNSQTPQDEN